MEACYKVAIQSGLRPREFWSMHPVEYWWWYEVTVGGDDWAELYELLDDG